MDDHDLLIRIDERTKTTDEKIDELKKELSSGDDRFLSIESHCAQKSEVCDDRFDTIEKEQVKVKTIGGIVAFFLMLATTILEYIRR